MADLSSFQNQRRIRIVTQRSGFTLAFLSCLIVRQMLLWFGAVKPEDSLGTLLLTKLHWFLAAGVIGGVTGASLSYYWYTRWLKKQPDNY